MRRRDAQIIVVASLLGVPAACSSAPTDSADGIPATGGASSGGANWGGEPGSGGGLMVYEAGGQGSLPHVACELGTPPSSFDVCDDVPCPEGIDCSSTGTAGAANGGTAGAAGAASGDDPLGIDLCPVSPAPRNTPGCSLWAWCIEPPMVVEGELRCCYRPTMFHCR